jgi:hypothetical protein
VKWSLSLISMCISFMGKNVEHFFMYLLPICVFENCLFSSFAYFLIELLFWFLILELFIYSGKDFIPFCGLSLDSGTFYPSCAETFKFDIILFINSCCYFQSNKHPIQKVIAYACIFKCLPLVISKF